MVKGVTTMNLQTVSYTKVRILYPEELMDS